MAPRPQGLAALAAWTLSGPWTGAGLVALTGGVALLPWRLPGLLPVAPLAVVLCAALLGLLVLERGLLTPSAALGAAGVFAVGLAMGASAPAAVLCGMVLAPVAGMAISLRYGRSLSLGLLAAAGLALVAMFATTVGLDAAAFAQRRAVYAQALALVYPQGAPASVEPMLEAMVRLSGGIFAVTLFALWVGALCLARSLQARVRAPGAFAAEFRRLRLGRWAGLLMAAVVVMAALTGLDGSALWAQSAVLVLGLGAVQGLAVLHAAVALRALWGGTLWVAYGGLVLAAFQTAALLAALGLLDNWLDLRGRLARRAGDAGSAS